MKPNNQLASDVFLEGIWLKAVFLIAMCLTWLGLGIVLLFKYKILQM